MYASLGDIYIFEGLVSFDTLSDKRETKYSQQALINTKPNIQRTGEALIEFSMGISFHVAFCNPEEEYQKLNNARVSGQVMPFIYGNGFNEGSYVITTLERTILQTDKIGNFIEIQVNIGLLEYAGGDSAAKQQEQDKKNAFALSSNRPLPANADLQMDNPALIVSQGNNNVLQGSNTINDATNTVNTNTNFISTGVINKAQAFMDQLEKYTTTLNAEILKSNNALGNVNNIIVNFSSITSESPTLPSTIIAVQGSLTATSAQLTLLNALPNPVTTIGQGNTALAALANTLIIVKLLIDNTKAMNAAAAPIARALATKKVMT